MTFLSHAGSVNPMSQNLNINRPNTSSPYSRNWFTILTDPNPGSEFMLKRSDGDWVSLKCHCCTVHGLLLTSLCIRSFPSRVSVCMQYVFKYCCRSNLYNLMRGAAGRTQRTATRVTRRPAQHFSPPELSTTPPGRALGLQSPHKALLSLILPSVPTERPTAVVLQRGASHRLVAMTMSLFRST